MALDALLPIAGSVLGGLGSFFGGQSAGQAQQQANEFALKMRKQAYDQMLNRAQGMAGTGQQAFYNLTNQQLPELGQMRQDILNQSADVLNQGSRQMQANLAQQGIRGGQAATLLNRGTGEQARQSQFDLNKMIYDEAQQRKLQQQAYEMAKAQAGLQGQLQQF